MNDAAGNKVQPQLVPAYRLVALDRVDSTNDEAKRLADAGAEDGTLVWAREQTGGRGRRGGTWNSPPGNLYLSIVTRPDCGLAQAAQLGFVTALGLGDAVGSVAPPLIEVTYKWPNDVLFNGRKGAGILLETKTTPDGALEWLVIGLGVNVTSHPEDTRYPATDLRFEGCPPDLDAVRLLEAFSRHFLVWVNRWLEDGFVPLRRTWLNHAEGRGKEIEVRLPHETLRGIFKDLDEDGALLLAMRSGAERRIPAGEIFPIQ